MQESRVEAQMIGDDPASLAPNSISQLPLLVSVTEMQSFDIIKVQ